MTVHYNTKHGVPDDFDVLQLRRGRLYAPDEPSGWEVRVRGQRATDPFRHETTGFCLADDDRGGVGKPPGENIQLGQSTVEHLSYPLGFAMMRERVLNSLLPLQEPPVAVVAKLFHHERGPEEVRKIVLDPVFDVQNACRRES